MRGRLQIALSAAVIGIALLAGALLYWTRPRLETEPPEVAPLAVQVVDAETRTVQLRVTTHGTVSPRTESDLIPQVSGVITWVSPSFVSGGFFEQGDVLLRIDPRDHEAALERARAARVRAQSEHERAVVEVRRMRGLRERNAASMAQLQDAESAERVAGAALREAEAALGQAERDLERTEIRAPYRGRVRSEQAGTGQFLTRGTPIARLYATDYVELRLPVPDSQLAYLDLPLWRDGSAAPVGRNSEVLLQAEFGGREHLWRGRVVRTEGEIDPRSRMVNVVARVEKPYQRDGDDSRPPLAVGLFVKAEILGRVVEQVVELPRSALRRGDRVMVVDGGARLRFRQVVVLRKDREKVLIESGLSPGERVVISPIENAIEGMLVRPVSDFGRSPS
jgi:RND family efflux transporter MFP subunit